MALYDFGVSHGGRNDVISLVVLSKELVLQKKRTISLAKDKKKTQQSHFNIFNDIHMVN